MPIPAVAIGIAAQIPKFVAGISQYGKANKALEELSKQKYPDYTSDPVMLNAYNRAEAMTKYGYSPEEQAQFNQALARNRSTSMRQATDMSGGQLSNAIGGVLQANQTDAINQFAAGGASLKRQNIQYADSLAQQLQQQKNLQTQSLIARRQMLEQQYGAAKSSALGNITGAFASAGAIGTQAALGGGRMGVEPGVVSETDEIVKYDASGNPTRAYLNSEEIAPEGVPTEEQLRVQYPELYANK